MAALARENFATAGVADIVTVVEGDAHKKLADLKGPIDLVFIDADKEGYLDYLTKMTPLVRAGGLIIAHNMDPRMGDPGVPEGNHDGSDSGDGLLHGRWRDERDAEEAVGSYRLSNTSRNCVS